MDTITRSIDESYSTLICNVNGRHRPTSSLDPHHEYLRVWDQLSTLLLPSSDEIVIYQGNKIVVPQAARGEILRLLHAGHAGVTKTTQTARQYYYWPGMSGDIDAMVANCHTCQSLRPSNPSPVVTPSNPATFPMEALGMDIFHCGGKDWLVIVDRYSGFPFVRRLPSLSSAATIRALEQILWEFGLPDSIRSDGGPQFTSSEFKDFLHSLDIRHEISSPYNPASNGLAEAGVKQVKYLMIKCSEEHSSYDRALHSYRSMARADGYSPFQLFFGRHGKSLLPVLAALLDPVDGAAATAAREKAREAWSAAAADRRRKCIYHPGDLVHVQHPISKRWSPGVISSSQRDHSYTIALDDGTCKTRNERFIRLRKSRKIPSPVENSGFHELSLPTDHTPHVIKPVPPPSKFDPPILRRSVRLAAQKSASSNSISSTMFGFSPYVSCPSPSTPIYVPTPLVTTPLPLVSASSIAPGPPTSSRLTKRCSPPSTMSRTVSTTSPTPSTLPTAPSSALATRPRPGETSPRMSTAAQSGFPCTTQVSGSPSGPWLSSCWPYLSSGPVSSPTCVGSLTSASSASLRRDSHRQGPFSHPSGLTSPLATPSSMTPTPTSGLVPHRLPPRTASPSAPLLPCHPPGILATVAMPTTTPSLVVTAPPPPSAGSSSMPGGTLSATATGCPAWLQTQSTPRANSTPCIIKT